MSRILWIARREFLATVTTKGFIIGLLITPTIIGMMIVVMPMLMNQAPPKVDGEVAILDPTGEVATGVADFLQPAEIARRRGDLKKKIDAATPDAVKRLTAASGAKETADAALTAALGEIPNISVHSLDAGADVEEEKKPLLVGSVQDGGRLALVVVDPAAVTRRPGEAKFGSYTLFVREKLDDRIEDEIKAALRESIVAARVGHAGLDRDEIDALTHVKRVISTTVTAEGEQKTNEIFNAILPAGFMILLLIAVLTGGQQILTTTIEEKSSRVIEVLLSAVSPMQIMAGKILGQLCVGMVMLVLYAGMGVVALISFALLGLVDLWLLVYLLIFYVIAYFTLGSLMAAIGSAVNEMSEAQGLMAPVMMTMMIPWILWMPISRDPNSVFATVCSFIPPINSFVILLRMSSTAPPPMWQVWLSILVGVAGVYGALWFAAKVFRVGLLMFGKPPNLATLIRWVRMA
ncbi:MAG: ABC transporter permease [Acidobacteriota bacterium]